MTDERQCRVCGDPLDPGQPLHHHTHRSCYFKGRRQSEAPARHLSAPSPAAKLEQLPGQLSLDSESGWERSAFIDWLDGQERVA
jgi:hypothetical protein